MNCFSLICISTQIQGFEIQSCNLNSKMSLNMLYKKVETRKKDFTFWYDISLTGCFHYIDSFLRHSNKSMYALCRESFQLTKYGKYNMQPLHPRSTSWKYWGEGGSNNYIYRQSFFYLLSTIYYYINALNQDEAPSHPSKPYSSLREDYPPKPKRNSHQKPASQKTIPKIYSLPMARLLWSPTRPHSLHPPLPPISRGEKARRSPTNRIRMRTRQHAHS